MGSEVPICKADDYIISRGILNSTLLESVKHLRHKMTARPLNRVLTQIICSEAHCCKQFVSEGLQAKSAMRAYATQSTLGQGAKTSRKQITVISDDGRVQWKDLSIREKAARTTQQSFNFGVILVGLLMTV